MNTRIVAALAAPAVLALVACQPVAGSAGSVGTICDYAPASKPTGKIGLSRTQKGHAETIINKAAEMGLRQRAAEVAITAALQESSLRNDGPPGDVETGYPAYGLFQMRPVIDGKRTEWGTYFQVTNPDYAAEKFYKVLTKVDGWRFMSHAAAAQAVEKSADGSLYRDDVDRAKKIVSRIAWEQCQATKPKGK